MGTKQFVNADEEFKPLLTEIFRDNLRKAEAGEEHLPINVEPDKIICLRLLSGGGKKIAYVRPIRGEYRLLTEARYFMVFCSEQFDPIQSIERKKWVAVHEYMHCWWNEETQDYETKKHNIEDFIEILKNPEPNEEFVKNIKWTQPNMFKTDKV